MGAILQPTEEMGPYGVEMRGSGFYLQRSGETADDESGLAEHVEALLIEPDELPALRAALMQVKQHPRFAEDRWDTARSWLTTEPPHRYAPEVIAEANAPWQVTRTLAAVVIAGPLWNPITYPSGAFLTEVEYGRLNDLLAALDALDAAPVTGPHIDLEAY